MQISFTSMNEEKYYALLSIQRELQKLKVWEFISRLGRFYNNKKLVAVMFLNIFNASVFTAVLRNKFFKSIIKNYRTFILHIRVHVVG